VNNVRAVVTASSAVPLGTGVAALPAAALAHVANRPLLHHVVLGLARAGVAEATLVADADTLPALQAALVEHRVRGVAMRHVERRRDASLLAAVLAAERGEDDATVVVVPAGSLCTFPVSALLQRQHDERLDALLTLPPGRDGREAAPGPPLVLGPQALRSLAGGGDLEGDALRGRERRAGRAPGAQSPRARRAGGKLGLHAGGDRGRDADGAGTSPPHRARGGIHHPRAGHHRRARGDRRRLHRAVHVDR
jgi:hypothetical protein